MTPRPLLAAAITLVFSVAACTSNSGTVRGIVVGVKGTLTSVEAFTVLVEGEEMTFLPVADGDYAFPLPHLGEHQRTGQPVFVDWVDRDGVLYAEGVRDG